MMRQMCFFCVYSVCSVCTEAAWSDPAVRSSDSRAVLRGTGEKEGWGEARTRHRAKSV